jgi:hypothetical protein
MHVETGVREIALAILVVAVTGCGPSEEARRKTDSAVAAAAQAKAATRAGEVISARREAQTYLDSARAGFVAKNSAVASKELRDAAGFTRGQADSATGAAKKALANSADELDRLATQVTKGAVKSVKTLDYAFSRTQLAESQYHHERAVAAWRGTKAAAAGAELVMVADHFERAIADAGQTASESAKKAVADTRALAAKLMQGTTVVPADVESTFAAMDKEVRNLMTTAAKLKG